MFTQQNARPPLSRSKAWTCLLINAAVCPGLGSLMARRLSGLPQLVLSWGGAIWMVVPLVRYFIDWLRLLQEPPEWRRYLQTGLGGLAFFLAGWFWAILTGVLLMRQARRIKAAPGEEPPRLVG